MKSAPTPTRNEKHITAIKKKTEKKENIIVTEILWAVIYKIILDCAFV